jgi:hypothetical protein
VSNVKEYAENPVDIAVREAQERGEFDNLPGAGKPLRLGNPNDPDWWIKGLIQREQLDMTAALPPGVALRREIERLPETLADVPTETAAREIVEDLNRRVLEDRRRLSLGPTVLAPTVDVDEVIAHWRADREARYGSSARTSPEPAESTASVERRPTAWWKRYFGRRERTSG